MFLRVATAVIGGLLALFALFATQALPIAAFALPVTGSSGTPSALMHSTVWI